VSAFRRSHFALFNLYRDIELLILPKNHFMSRFFCDFLFDLQNHIKIIQL